jgi:hypothetical protein
VRASGNGLRSRYTLATSRATCSSSRCSRGSGILPLGFTIEAAATVEFSFGLNANEVYRLDRIRGS